MFGVSPTYFSGERFFDFPVIVRHVSWSVQKTQAQDQDRISITHQDSPSSCFHPLEIKSFNKINFSNSIIYLVFLINCLYIFIYIFIHTQLINILFNWKSVFFM